uniref:Mononegavirus-type SAM-dependent 2'-O-MTase domain-containing protein n=1 Tax=Nelumbo nucifera TaxID=4432 RepID=A0A822ZEI4_NELNU|nr:TPA_asm: hypothetical protein HUJ06_001772 [Nelumbo nucifera]
MSLIYMLISNSFLLSLLKYILCGEIYVYHMNLSRRSSSDVFLILTFQCCKVEDFAKMFSLSLFQAHTLTQRNILFFSSVVYLFP